MANNYDQIITKTITKISETGEVNASDILVLKFCTKEKKRDASGTVTLQMYLNGAALPCTLRQMTGAAYTEYTLTTHAAAFLSGSCAMIKPVVSVVIGGVAGTVNWMSESVKT